MYNFKKIEKKWQDIWEKEEAFVCENNSDKPKYYYLIEFPYPSGAGLHVGHVRSQTALDSMARKKRMQGFNVLYPIGWDSFGLPTEQYAIKTHIHPKIATKENIEIPVNQQIQVVSNQLNCSPLSNTICIQLIANAIPAKPTISNLLLYFCF